MNSLLTSLLVLACVCAASAEYCPRGYTKALNSCYRRSASSVEGGLASNTWASAKTDCERRGATLVTKVTANIFLALGSAPFEGQFWVGLSTSAPSVFHWLDEFGVVTLPNAWWTGNVAPTTEGCAFYDFATKRLTLQSCASKQYWFCQSALITTSESLESEFEGQNLEESRNSERSRNVESRNREFEGQNSESSRNSESRRESESRRNSEVNRITENREYFERRSESSPRYETKQVVEESSEVAETKRQNSESRRNTERSRNTESRRESESSRNTEGIRTTENRRYAEQKSESSPSYETNTVVQEVSEVAETKPEPVYSESYNRYNAEQNRESRRNSENNRESKRNTEAKRYNAESAQASYENKRNSENRRKYEAKRYNSENNREAMRNQESRSSSRYGRRQ